MHYLPRFAVDNYINEMHTPQLEWRIDLQANSKLDKSSDTKLLLKDSRNTGFWLGVHKNKNENSLTVKLYAQPG